jgi:phosphopantothenoylcysteine decarboxylase/phosphopantothenate--cysteine ligase
VTLVASNLSVPVPVGVDVVQAPTAEDVARETLARGDADVVVMAAAVADYRPAEAEQEKRPKDDRPGRSRSSRRPTSCASSARGARTASCWSASRPTAASAGSSARGEARQQAVDLIVFNDVSRDDIGFDRRRQRGRPRSRRGERAHREGAKERIAAAILDEVAAPGGADGRGGR